MAVQPFSANPPVGISGMAIYVPPYRVDLERWSDWTGNDASKIRAVVGHAFRMPGPDQNVYTLAANAVLRLIAQYGIDPRRVGYLALGTESSIDNAAGAVIVRGLVDQALASEGKPVLARDCEVPEFKHACLGGVYALKGGLRYLACDGRDRQAIAVSADIAEYARGSSGEPTQGAGAVAMLLETSPRLLELDLAKGGSASEYRGLVPMRHCARWMRCLFGATDLAPAICANWLPCSCIGRITACRATPWRSAIWRRSVRMRRKAIKIQRANWTNIAARPACRAKT